MAKAPEPHNDEKDPKSIGPQKGEFIPPPDSRPFPARRAIPVPVKHGRSWHASGP